MVYFEILTKTIEEMRLLAQKGKLSWEEYNQAVEANAKLHYELAALSDRAIKLNVSYTEMIAACNRTSR